MKTKILALLLAFVTLFSLASCSVPEPEQTAEKKTEVREMPYNTGIPTSGAWKDAEYRENKTFGTGEKSIVLNVVIEGFYVEFTVKTDKETLAEALLEHKIVEMDENDPYGHSVKKVNGVVATAEKNQHYWSFEIQAEPQLHGIDEEVIESGERFELVYTKIKETERDSKDAAPCNSGIPKDGAWEKAKYRENKIFGKGAKTVTLYVVADGYYVEFTIKTDKETLAEALLEHGIVEGDENGPYGLYIKKVNGIDASAEKNQHYWSFEIEAEAQLHGVSEEVVEDGEKFELVYRSMN